MLGGSGEELGPVFGCWRRLLLFTFQLNLASFVRGGSLFTLKSVKRQATLYQVKTMPMKNPPHPGDFIRTEIIEPAGLSVTAAAAALRVSRPALSSLLNGKADLSGDMALRIEKAFGVKMDTLMRMQAAYDIAQTRKREKRIHVRRIASLADARV